MYWKRFDLIFLDSQPEAYVVCNKRPFGYAIPDSEQADILSCSCNSAQEVDSWIDLLKNELEELRTVARKEFEKRKQ